MVKIYDELEQGSEAWFEARRGKMTASHANTIRANGAGLKTYAVKKALEIFSEERERQISNHHTKRGNELEPVAVAHFELKKGLETYEIGFAEHDEFVGVSPDRIVVGERALVEVKCPAMEGFGDALKGKDIPSMYKDQMEMQLYVMEDYDFVYFVQFNPNFPVPIIIRKYYSEPKRRKELLQGLERGRDLIKEQLYLLKEGSKRVQEENNAD